MKENQGTRHSTRKFSEEEKRNYLVTWEKSNLNRTDFSKLHGISRSALYQWAKEFKKADNVPGFSPLTIEAKLPITDLVQLNIAFNNNSMQLNIAIPGNRLVSFIQEICYATTAIQ